MARAPSGSTLSWPAATISTLVSPRNPRKVVSQVDDEVHRRPDGYAARRHDHVHRLVGDQALGAGLGVAEGRAGTSDEVGPRLERGGRTEVVDRQPDHDGVGIDQLGDEFVGDGECGALVEGALIGRRPHGEQRLLAEQRNAVGQVPRADGLLAPEAVDQATGELAAHRAVGASGGIDAEDVGHGPSLREVFAIATKCLVSVADGAMRSRHVRSRCVPG